MKIKKRTLRSAPHEATDGTIRQSIDVAGFALEQGLSRQQCLLGSNRTPPRSLYRRLRGKRDFRYNRRTQR